MLLLAVALLVSATVAAQPYPSRTVRIVVPATPGGAIDLIARSLAEPFTIGRLAPAYIELFGRVAKRA